MFGTLLYELFADSPPFSGQPPHAIIYQIGRGHQPPTIHLQCTNIIKVNQAMFILFTLLILISCKISEKTNERSLRYLKTDGRTQERMDRQG